MKKLIPYLTILLILVGCANSDDSEVFSFSTHDTLYYNSNNSLASGTNYISYDSDKTLHTLIYYAMDPANDEYDITNRFRVSGSNSFNENSSRQSAYNSKTVSDTSYSPDNLSERNNMKSKIIDINKDIEKYVKDNDIISISKEKDTALYRTTMPQAVEVGTEWEDIWVLDTTSSSVEYSKIRRATCIGVSKYAYFFLDDTLEDLTEEQIEALISSFDKDYEIISEIYGTAEDTDNNGKVTFLIADLNKGIFGFFYSADKYTNSRLSATDYKSNEADVLYINHKYFVGTDDDGNDNWEEYGTDLRATLAHEYQHMVLFDYRNKRGLDTSVATWINEGLSMLTEFHCGYASTHYAYLKNYFLYNQGISLITNDSGLDYGLSYLFARYLQIRFGNEYIQKIYASKNTDTGAIEDATDVGFNELFLDFMKMVLSTGRGVETSSRYDIEEFNHAEGTSGYEENGFNLSLLIDDVYDGVAEGRYPVYNSSMFNTSSGYTSTYIDQYSFIITRWSSNINTLTIASEYEDVSGMYYAW